MAIRIDPENYESRALFELVDFAGCNVLEIGCGDGRLTWRYAERAPRVTAIDPSSEAIGRAREGLPEELHGRVEFRDVAFEAFAAASGPSRFELILLSWSL